MRRFRESSGTSNKKEAQRLLRERMGNREAGKLIGRPDKVTLADLKAGLERHYTRENNRSWASAKTEYLDARLAEGAARAPDSLSRAMWRR